MTRVARLSRLRSAGTVAVVGSGPNGLAAAVVLARAGCAVTVFESAPYFGGSLASRELTLPGFRHDVGAAVPAMALESEFFRRFELESRIGVAIPEVSFAHPLLGDAPALAFRDLTQTAARLGADGAAWRRLFEPLVARTGAVVDLTMAAPLRFPQHPVLAARLGARVLGLASSASWGARWRGAHAPALLAGAMAHVGSRLPSLTAAGVGVVLTALAHGRGWPFAVGGSQAIVDALVADVRAHGGSLFSDSHVGDLAELAEFDAVVLNVSAKAVAGIAGAYLPARVVRTLRAVRYGVGSAKVDLALAEPIPWRDAELLRAGTVHLGGSFREVFAAERGVLSGRRPRHPFVLLTQPTLVDPSRAPAGRHTVWAYTHVPNGAGGDEAEAVIRQIERFAPGVRDVIIGQHSESAAQLGVRNVNLVGGDVSSGAMTLGQLVRRPVLSRAPWRLPIPGVYWAAGGTSPGPAIHGLAGYRAAVLAAADVFGVREEISLAPHPVQ